MKILNIKLYFFLTIIFSFQTFLLFSQTLNETIKFADSLVIEKKYNLAIKEYQRVIFFQDSINFEIYLKIADCYYFTDNYNEAIKYFKLFNDCNIDSSKIIDCKFKIINCHIQNTEFQTALLNLYSLPNNLNREQNQRKNFYLGVCYYYFDNYETSLKYFIESIDTNNVENKIILDDFFSNKSNFRYPNPKLSLALSLIFPGSGQIYCGELKSGINSLLLTASLLFMAYEISSIYKPFDAIITFFPYFERYYLGGSLNAYNLAINKKSEKKSEKFIQLMDIFENQKK